MIFLAIFSKFTSALFFIFKILRMLISICMQMYRGCFYFMHLLISIKPICREHFVFSIIHFSSDRNNPNVTLNMGKRNKLIIFVWFMRKNQGIF